MRAPRPRKPADPAKQAKILAELHKDRDSREKSYRERALQMFPHICASCMREFEGRRLRELTVHHKDHNHENNPPDGSNWELLCVYCHDNEHEKYKMEGHYSASRSQSQEELPPPDFKPFEALDSLLKKPEGNIPGKSDNS